MTLRTLLATHARALARSRAARLSGWIVLVGATLVAAALFFERAGYEVPLIEIPGLPDSGSAVDRVIGFVAISLAGLLQGVALLVVVFLLALGVRLLGAHLLRPKRPRVAAALDRALETDRFASALEAAGPLAPLVERRATERAPSKRLLIRRPSRARRWLGRLAVVLVLLVALAPGTAPGAEGRAPVRGAPEDGHDERALALRLVGTKDTFASKEPVPVQVIAEAAFPPEKDLDLPLRILLDAGPEIATDERLFLAAGAPGQDAVTLDLRALAKHLTPGEHRAVARAGGVESNAYIFRIEPPGSAGGKKPPPDPPPPSKGGGGGDRGGDQEPAKPKFVEPLVREGRKVEKKAKVPIEVPGGGAPTERTLEEAWPELERRREAALNRPGLSPAARKLVRDYFDRLRPEKEK